MRDVFRDIGMTNAESKTLEYLLLNNSGESRYIERKMELRQPEVCVALKLFVHKGWVARKKIIRPSGGKGRPSILFSLKKTKTQILDELIRGCGEKINKLTGLVKSLNEFKEENNANKKKTK